MMEMTLVKSLHCKHKRGKIKVKDMFHEYTNSPYVSDTVYGTHTGATAAFWRTFRHDGKISPRW
jgi:hypothetical protein